MAGWGQYVIPAITSCRRPQHD